MGQIPSFSAIKRVTRSSHNRKAAFRRTARVRAALSAALMAVA